MPEARTPLINREASITWTAFERDLFNLVTLKGDGNQHIRLLFSQRLRVVQAMLNAYDAEIAAVSEEEDFNA